MKRLGPGAWDAFERTLFADVLAAALLVLILAVVWIAGAL